MIKAITIVGGGTAGWVTANYLARMLSSDRPGGVQLTVIEAPEIGPIGVGEGTFPSILKTLSRIGLDERLLFTEAGATFKQGVRFENWARGDDSYYHLFHPVSRPGGMDLLPYWLLGEGGGLPWASAANPQARVIEGMRGPKQPGQPDYAGTLAYAYHIDAVAFAGILARHAVKMGVKHITDKVVAVHLDADGAINRLATEKNGDQRADLYIDCTGFRAQLIGDALNIPFVSRRNELFVDRAVAIQQPYDNPAGDIPSCTKARAEKAGWIWDIGLRHRRGVGYVYSSDHGSEDDAIKTLKAYMGPGVEDIEPRRLAFETGYRKTQWHKNCVAIGLSAGFVEPLEATGIGLAESAGLLLAAVLPWAGPLDVAARQFNDKMTRRFENIFDFIKLHYCLSQRRDSDFWIDNCRAESLSDALKDRLERWRYRMPDFIDVDYGHDTFVETNWRQVLYGMRFPTDLSARRDAYRYFDAARAAFREVERHADKALRFLPSHRDLVEAICRSGQPPVRSNTVGRVVT
ncbi:Flavin-dependent tryptophan halogenase PrnA (plasmid) [Asticcacaulis sp. MM231]|uniref:tryptophan halogenase family protein n=1 Tax=Asticcacaulis sp. MM231 TaxID=3157666 RepID=UPI0032D5ACB2